MTDTLAEGREDKSRPWERHMQTILTALVLAGVMWLAQTTSDTARQLAVMETRIGALNERLEDMRKALDGQDARYATRFELVTVQKTVEALGARVDSMEGRR